ncbi:MAG: hypothetical protein PHD47_03360 [Acholeplasmataceae bacterium]|nr:hypothetical protein [Acholeplasmataceae bacterium]
MMEPKRVIRRRNVYLISYLVIVAVIFTSVALVFIYIPDENISTLIALLLMIVLAILSGYFKNTITSYNNLARIAKLIIKQADAIPYSKDPFEIPFVTRGFDKIHANDRFTLYAVGPKEKDKNNTPLQIIVLIYKDIDFYDKEIDEEIEKLEKTYKKQPRRYQIIAFKQYPKIGEKEIKALGEVVSYTVYRRVFTQINIGINTENQKAYFLHSNEYSPNRNYLETVEWIKSILL